MNIKEKLEKECGYKRKRKWEHCVLLEESEKQMGLGEIIRPTSVESKPNRTVHGRTAASPVDIPAPRLSPGTPWLARPADLPRSHNFRLISLKS